LKQAKSRVVPSKTAAIALLLLVLAAYSNSFQGSFVLDNRGLLLNDPRLREASAQNIGLIFQHTYWWPNGESGLYRPFTTLSYLANYAVLGNAEAPFGYHAINFLLHASNVLLVFALALRFLRKPWTAFFIAALWAVHPVLTESVTNIAGRADLLAAACVLGGLLTYLKAVEASGWRRVAWFAGLSAITALGVFSKESAIVIVGAIVLYELTFRSGRPQLLAAIAVLTPIALMLYLRHQVLSHTLPMEIPFTDNPIAWAGFVEGRLTALNVMAHYFFLLIWPLHLSADYSWSQIPLARNWIVGVSVLAVIPLTILLFRWNRFAFFLFVLGLAWLAPASNLLFPIGTIMAERFLYLTALGFIACVVPALLAAAEKIGAARIAPALLCLLIAALAVRTWERNRDWNDNLTIASASVLTSPESFKAHDLLANVLFTSDPAHGNIRRVIEESERSLAILDPLPDERKPADPYRFAANCYMLRGTYAKAIPVLLKLIAIEMNSVAGFRKNLATRHASPENTAGIDSLERSSNLRISDAYLMLSAAYSEVGDTAHAADAVAHAGTLNPLSPQFYRQTADVATTAGRMDDAAVALVEGAFITSDKSLRQALVQLYQNGMGPKSCALQSAPGGPAINPTCPIVHAHVCAASAVVVRTLQAAQQTDLAQTRKKMFIEQFGCPPQPLEGAR
jgi:protein O-mannosyl-transferase